MAKERSIWMLVTFILVLIILYLHQCRRAPVSTEVVTTTKRDTVYQVVRDTTIWKVPVVKKVIETDTLTRYFPVNQFIDTLFLLHDYLVTRYYEDTTHIQHGYIVTRDSVTENKIVAHQVEHKLQLPVIMKTITLQAPPRTQLYAGLGMISGRNDFIHGFEGTISLKNKADQIYSLGGIIEPGGAMYWKGSVMFKLSLKNKTR